MTEDTRSLAQRVQDGTVSTARSFFGASLGRLQDQIAGDRSKLEDLERQLDHEDALARLRGLIDSYSTVEASIAEVHRDLGLEDDRNEASARPRDPEGRDDGPSPHQRDQASSGVQDLATGAVEGAVGAAGQLAGQAVSQVAGQVEQLTALPDGQLLGRTTDGSGRTVQRVAYGPGDIIQTTLDESGELLEENPVGNLADLPPEEEATTEEGHTLRTVKDESGTLVKLEIGPDGDVLDLEILPDDRA